MAPSGRRDLRNGNIGEGKVFVSVRPFLKLGIDDFSVHGAHGLVRLAGLIGLWGLVCS